MGMKQAAASTCLPGSRLTHGYNAQGSPGEADPADRLADLHQEVAKATPGAQTELPRVEESSCHSPTLPGSLPKLQMTPSLSSSARPARWPGGGVGASPLLGDYRQTSDYTLPTQVPSPGSGKGEPPYSPFLSAPSPIFSPFLYFSSSTHKGEEKPKKLIEVDVLDVPLSSFSFCHSLFLSLPLSLLLPLSLITSGSQAQLSFDSAHTPPIHLSSGPI